MIERGRGVWPFPENHVGLLVGGDLAGEQLGGRVQEPCFPGELHWGGLFSRDVGRAAVRVSAIVNTHFGDREQSAIPSGSHEHGG
jgi:hypothetical protein